MIRLICIDVDGTLVGTSGEVRKEVWACAEQARARGVRLALCSGRPGFGKTREYARRLDDTGWHVFQNGASVLSLGSGATRSSPLEAGNVARLIDRAREMNRTLELYTDTSYVVEQDSTSAATHAGILGVPFAPRPFASLEGIVVRAQWLLAPEEEEEERAERARFSGLEVAASTSPLMPGTTFVNMTNDGTHKGSAVAAVAAAYGFDLADVMFVGDGDNDLPAMRLVGHPVAMGNAEPGVRAIARYTVGHVDAEAPALGGLAEAFALVLAMTP